MMKKKVLLWVWGIHITWVVLLCFSGPRPQEIKRKIVVHMRTKEEEIVKMPSPAPVKRTPSPPSSTPKVPAPSPPPVPSPPAPSLQKKKQKAAPQKSSPVKKEHSGPKVSEELTKQLEESIAKIEKKQDNLWRGKKEEQLPALEPVRVDVSAYSDTSAPCVDSVVAYLQGKLHLPDYGDVRVEITIGQDGRVVRMVVLEAESEKNRRYLERELPLVRFPLLRGEESLVLTFCTGIR